MSPILDQQDVIVRDSIIKNKERTKSYWEHLMLAAVSDGQKNAKTRIWDTTDNSVSDSNSNRNIRNSYNTEMNSIHCNDNNNYRNYIESDNNETLKNCVRSDLSFSPLSMEDRIALELQEQKEREEELKKLRRQLSLESGKELSPSKDINHGSEELSSIHTNDDSNFSEYGSEEKEHSLDGNNSSRVNTPYSEGSIHRRTRSLDSVSSGLSSGSASTLNENDRDSPRKKVIVRPYEDPHEEEVPTYMRSDSETPIEREIRIAKEREEELRKEKGIMLNNNVKKEQSKVQKISNQKDAVENDPRDVQHRLATNRIQQEIEEANERENELRTEGKILTTSEETVDAKVTRFTQLAEFAILENRHKDSKMKRSLSVSHLVASENENRPKDIPVQANSPAPRSYRKYAPNPAQKGIMQRFIATKGKLSLPVMNTDTQLMNDKPARRVLSRSSTGGIESYTTIRKGYIPAGEKIQEELKEMEKREQELRLQRAHNPLTTGSITVSRHLSQPNLLNLSDDDNADDEELNSWTSHKENTKLTPRLAHSQSNPNLLDDSLEKVNIRLPNKRFSLLQQWENRIQNAQ